MPSKRRRGMCGSLLSAFHVAVILDQHAFSHYSVRATSATATSRRLNNGRASLLNPLKPHGVVPPSKRHHHAASPGDRRSLLIRFRALASDKSESDSVTKSRSHTKSEEVGRSQAGEDNKHEHRIKKIVAHLILGVHQKTTQEHADAFPGEAAARANLEGVYGSGFAFGRKYLDVVKSHHAFFALCSASVFKKALSNKPVPYSLGYGSMLGYERHKSIIPYDNDGDVFVPISFFRIVEDFAVREQNLILDATKKFALLDVEGDPSSGAAPFKVAVTYGGAPIASLDEIFDESQAEHVLFLTDASYKSLVLKPNEDALVTTPTFPEALARAHGTQAFTWGAGPLGGRFVMRHKRNPAGMPTSTVLDHPKSFVDHGALFYSFIDVVGWSAEALDMSLECKVWRTVSGVTPPNLALADLRRREEEQEELGQSSSEDSFPATVEVAFPVGGSNKVQIFANEEVRKNLVQSCYGEESITTPLFTWNAGAWKKNPTWRPSR